VILTRVRKAQTVRVSRRSPNSWAALRPPIHPRVELIGSDDGEAETETCRSARTGCTSGGINLTSIDASFDNVRVSQ